MLVFGYIRSVFVTVVMTVLSTSLCADTVILPAQKDNTLYSEGDLSNGAGDHLFAGAIRIFNFRRVVVQFDIDGNIPAGASINSVQLTLNVSMVPTPIASDVGLFRLTRAWGESTSIAPDPEGGGAVAKSGDATWRHTFSRTNHGL